MNEVPLLPWWMTIVLAVWVPLGPLVGIFIAHYLFRSQQRRQWVADNEVKEWRELLTTLTTSFQTIVRTNVLLPPVPGEEIERLKEGARARFMANEVLTNRIFISHEVNRCDMFTRWTAAMDQFDQDHNPKNLGTAFGELNALILIGARTHIGKV